MNNILLTFRFACLILGDLCTKDPDNTGEGLTWIRSARNLRHKQVHSIIFQRFPDPFAKVTMNEPTQWNRFCLQVLTPKQRKMCSCILKLSTIHSLFSINIHVSCKSLGERIENEWMVSFDISQWDPSGDKGAPLPPQITKETRKFNLNLNRFPFRLWRRERQGFVFRGRFENYEMECIEFV